jgi:hypothetical protein
MGTMLFQLPPNLPDQAIAELECASIAGGQDCMPYPTQAIVEDNQLVVQRRLDESGCINVPWDVPGAGRLMVHSATLMERLAPYDLLIELARGKINQLRGQMADWLMGGLMLPPPLAERIQQATRQFAKAVARTPSAEALAEAQQALAQGFAVSEDLVQAYVDQVFQVRHSRQPRLDTWLSCGMTAAGAALPSTATPGGATSGRASLDVGSDAASSGPAPSGAAFGQTPPSSDDGFLDAFNAVQIYFPWREIAAEDGRQSWDAADAAVDWAFANNLHVCAGPLIDFTGRDFPDWLWEKERDLLSLSGYLCDHVDAVVRRYCGRIRCWQVSAASNWAGVLAMRDEELLWLTMRLLETIKKVESTLETTIGIAQPWGDYLVDQDCNQSPFVFADNLLRTGVKLAGLDIEMLMGVAPRGSYCRDTLDASRIMDLYALLGVPLHVTLGYPSAGGSDDLADPDQRAQGGYWRTGFAPEAQADWVKLFAALAVCKPYVRCVRWPHFSDAQPHGDPHCGLLDGAGRAKPALGILRQLREAHLK